MRSFSFVKAKTQCFLAAIVLVCVEVIVMSSAMTYTGALGGGMSAV